MQDLVFRNITGVARQGLFVCEGSGPPIYIEMDAIVDEMKFCTT